MSCNHDAIELCGVPDFVMREKLRFLMFLEHGYDERGWTENNHAFFDSKILTDSQMILLAPKLVK